MNRYCYRLVFNKAKGRRVVASEAATSERQDGAATPRGHMSSHSVALRRILGTLQPLAWSILLALGLVPVPVHAQIAPDRSAPGSQRPHVLNSANGTPQVNITSPNAKGVSRNAYRQFDVDGKGAILNNARTATPTRIGGWVQSNPNLATGEARVIVNEINSSNPSRLHGAVEVAGRRAEVVIANPAGIDVDGAGFINTQGITLTTGQPQYDNGALDDYRVEGGTVRIHGDGFDAGDADYAAILARAADIQAGVWAEELEVVTGANRISADRQAIDTIEGSGESPSVGIDVAHLGGMYAGKIHLMATERGVGVHHAGDMVADEIVVEADGRITNHGRIATREDMRLASRGDIANYGSLRAGDELVATSDDEIANRDSGTFIARDDIQLSAATLSSDSDSLLAAGVRDDGALGEHGDLTISATRAIEGRGQHIAAGGLYAQAETVALRDSHTQAHDIDIVAGQEGIDASGATLAAQGELSTSTPGSLRTDDASVVADTLTLDIGALSNIGGDIVQLGEQPLSLTLETFDNTSGRLANNSGTLEIEAEGDIDNTQGQWLAEQVDVSAAGLNNSDGLISASSGELRVQADELDNTQGRLEATDDLTLDIADTLTNEGGEIVHAGEGMARIGASHIEGSDGLIASQGELTLKVDSIVLDGAATNAERIAVQAEHLSHRQGEMQQVGDAAALALNVDQSLDNTEGLISASSGELRVQLDELDNTQGRLEAAGNVTLAVDEMITNRGGEIVHAGEGAARIDATRMDGSDGLIVSQGELTLNADSIVLDGATTNADSIALQAERLSHRQGEMQQVGDSHALALNVDQSLDNTGGLIAGNAGLDIATFELTNTAGTLQAVDDIGVNAGSLHNHGGDIVAGDTLAIEAEGDIDNTQGRLEAAADLSLDIADVLTNESGEIVHAGAGATRIGASHIEGSDGLIVSQSELTLNADSIVLDGATTSADSITLHAERLSHRQGEMSQHGDDAELLLAIREALDNREGWIASLADISLDAGDLVNHSGMLQAADDVRLETGTLNNRQGEILAGDSLGLDVNGGLDNTGGRVVASGDAALSTASLINADGILATQQGDLSLDSLGTIDNRQGRLEAGGGLASVSRALDNRNGDIIATAVDLTTQAHRLNNRGGLIAARESLELASGELDNTGGTLQAGDGLALDTHGKALLNTEAGTILGEDDVSLTVGGLDNTAGLIGAGTGLDLRADTITNRDSGTLLSEADMYAAAASLDNHGGQLQALGDLSLDLNGRLGNRNGLMRAGQTLELSANQVSNRHTQGDDQGIEGHRIQLDADELDNRQGTIRADQLAEIQVDEGVNNRDGLISSLDTLAIQANDIDNRAGTLIADRALDLTTARLTGDGRVLSLGDLALRLAGDFTLSVSGEMMAEDDLHLVTSGSIDNRGRLSAGDTLSIEAGRLDNAADGELSGTTTQIDVERLTNRGLIDGIETHIVADVLDNLGTGRIYGDRLGIQAGTLTNDVENGQAAAIAARERLDIGAHRLTNREDALIFSAGDMAIGGRLDANSRATGRATRLENNSATIEALGDLSLSAARLDNTNEHFETELVQVADLPQQRYIEPSGWDEKLPESEFTWLNTVDYGIRVYQGGYLYGRNNILTGGATILRWMEYDAERTEYESQVVHSRPGQILAGGDMYLGGDELLNDKSQILAGGVLSGDLERLENRKAQGTRYVEESGIKRSSSPSGNGMCQGSNGCGWREYSRKWSEWQDYSYSGEADTFALPVTAVGGNHVIDGSDIQPAAHTGTSLDASAQGSHGAQVNLQTNGPDGRVIEVPALHPPATRAEASLALGDRQMGEREEPEWLASIPLDRLQEVIGTDSAASAEIERLASAHHALEKTDVEPRADTPTDRNQESADTLAAANLAPLGMIRSVMPNVTLPANSLFQINPEPTAHYLVETDPRFTDRREWLGSDYMLDALQSDPSTVQQRLGDGFYEQRLVNEQIMQLTGQRYLAGHGNDDEQYRALMNAGITFAEEHDLRPGVALTAEQMAQLTSDIVWLVEQEVTREDGSITTVLVPQVYARVREGDLHEDGTLIAGDSLTLDVRNDIVNTGTLAGRELVELTAENIANLGGRIGGNRVDLEARNDLDNIGGEITAGESLALRAGRDLTLASTPERLAGLYVTEAGGGLSADAGRDLSVVGADLDSAGKLQLGAGRDLDVTSTLVSDQTNLGYRLSSTELERGTTLSAGSDLVFDAGRDLTLTAVEASADGDGLLSAGRDVTLDALATHESRSAWWNTTRESAEIGTQLDIGGSLALLAGQDIAARTAQLNAGDDLTLSAGRDISLEAGLSRQYEEARRGRTHTIDSQTRVQSTTLETGGDLLLQAGNDLRLTASQLRAEGDAALMAGDRIDLLTAQEEDYSLYESRSSGLFSSSYRRDEEHDIRDVGTHITAGDDMTIVSSGDQHYSGARLEAGQNLALLSDGEIAFDMASDLRQESHERSKSNFVSQSAKGKGTTRETLRQSELVAQGDILLQAEQGIHALYTARRGESLDQAIERAVADNPDLAWLQTLQGRDDVTWESVDAFRDEWSYSHSGLSPIASTILTAVVSYYTANAASGMIGNLSGTAAGSQATFAAGATTASDTVIAAGSGNAILSGIAGGAVGSGVGAFSQGGDWREAAWRGGVTGGFTGYLSGGTYYDNSSVLLEKTQDYLSKGDISAVLNQGAHIAMQQVYGELQQKMADGVGLNSDELNWLLMAGSITGDALVSKERNRYTQTDQDYTQSAGVGGRGWLHRGPGHIMFDAVDTALTYQDLPTNTVHNYLYDPNRAANNTAYTGHSLGTGDGAYLGRHGLVETTYLYSVPFGIVAPSNAKVTLGSGDLVNGGVLGKAFNWDAKVVPLLPWEHNFDNYKRFIKAVD
ncbi:two-partner secretion domain-containing protein [Aidingimonas lacisalsi]|uniref:two-partner secretion domain-containing protein n=1 Tax=Aidingimonas lacisalsi TaxID=2604086 RepID=UPI0011D2162D|nr:filamentous hemagglutinin N-terminal domain-containing protein [Aidingimonas lacisalsi]